jgi:pimeloyl-ACP methyl ester carboxylesterase
VVDFVLVHGAWHGAWCWDELVPELEARGHRALAIDLPGMGRDETPSDQVTLESCAARVAEAVTSLEPGVWLVGHSMGGRSITQAAEQVADRLAALVYVTAVLPLNGESSAEMMRASETSRETRTIQIDETGGITVPQEFLRPTFYQLCSDAQVERAQKLLRRSQPLAPATTPVSLTDDNYGRVPRYYVECLQDRALSIDVQRRMHQAAGVRAVATLDTDHSPFFSCPSELADTLDRFATGST